MFKLDIVDNKMNTLTVNIYNSTTAILYYFIVSD